jgi:hypothetical protein
MLYLALGLYALTIIAAALMDGHPGATLPHWGLLVAGALVVPRLFERR